MAVCKTIRTRNGIKEFLVNSENGDEHVTAFKYKDGKAEVHSLRIDCPPLYLDENVSLSLLSDDNLGCMLLAVNPKHDDCLEVRAWDVAGSNQGFVPKDVMSKGDSKKESKHKYSYYLQAVFKENISEVVTTSFGSFLCLVLNSKICLLMKFKLLDSGCLLFELKSTFTLNDAVLVSQAMFLKAHDKFYLTILENTLIKVLLVENDSLSFSSNLTLPLKGNGPRKIAKLYKVTPSKCLVIDNQGQLSLLAIPNELTPLKFPNSVNGHSICSTVGFKHTSEGILAICNQDYTVNFYLLADILCSISNGISSFVKPYRVFCSQFPINAISFVKSDQLAMVSAVNQSITFLGGLAKSNFK